MREGHPPISPYTVATPAARPDVLVEVEDVLRVDGVLERGQPGQHRRRVGAAHAGLPVVAERVDVCPAGERLDPASALPDRRHPVRVLGGVGPAGGPDVFEGRPAVPESRRVRRNVGDRPTVRLQARPHRRIVGQQRLDRGVGQRGEVVALPVAPKGVALRSVAARAGGRRTSARSRAAQPVRRGPPDSGRAHGPRPGRRPRRSRGSRCRPRPRPRTSPGVVRPRPGPASAPVPERPRPPESPARRSGSGCRWRAAGTRTPSRRRSCRHLPASPRTAQSSRPPKRARLRRPR